MRVYQFHHSRIWLFQGCLSSTSCGKATLYITQEFAFASAKASVPRRISGDPGEGMLLQQVAHCRQGHDGAVGGVGFVIGLDIGQLVAVVDHQSGRLPEALGRGVAQPVETLDASPVREMEMSHPVERRAMALFLQQIAGGAAQQQRPQCLYHFAIIGPVGPGQQHRQSAGRVVGPGQGLEAAFLGGAEVDGTGRRGAFQPTPKARHRRNA